jgi:prophage regulatory protein
VDEPKIRKLIRRRDLPTFAGLHRTQIEELVKKGEFPKPIKLSDEGRAVAWFEDEIAAWQEARNAKRSGG